jgi:hypothetical protein
MDTQGFSHYFNQAQGDIVSLNRWIFDTIQPYIKGRTIELGSCQGAIASIFTEHGLPIHLSDEHRTNRDALREKFQEVPGVRMIHDIDFLDPGFKLVNTSSLSAFDTVVAINVTEHGFYNKIALNNAKHLLRIRGHFMMIAQAHTAFYNGLEEDLSEWKKHNASDVEKLMGANVAVLKVRYFNWVTGTQTSQIGQSGLSTLAILRKLYD